MNSLTDQQLLSDYSERRSEVAFAELVRRHVDFVYSAARRMVRDAHLAEDVTQGVFVALAQNARQLTNHPVLPGWLHRTAQNLAANTVRSDVRRRVREQKAAAMNELISAEPDALSRRSETQADGWEQIAPHLDAALGELGELDHAALLLRYFQNKSAREMAQILDTTEDAAQKRVSRAVDRLRELFSKRGVTVGAGGLIAVISANAVQAAPAGLAAAISSAAVLAGTTITATTAATITKAIVMTTLQKTLITATIAIAVGAGIYEARQASQLREQVQTLQRQQASYGDEIQRLQRERDEAANRLSALAGERERAEADSGELLKLRTEMTRLRQEADAAAIELRRARELRAAVSELASNIPPIRTFVATAAVTAFWDQTIVAGGWKLPSGRRALLLLAFDPAEDRQRVTIKSRLVEYANDAAGLSQFNTDTQSASTTHLLDSNQADSLLKAATDSKEAEIKHSPILTTLSGQQAMCELTGKYQVPSGESYSTGMTLHLVPTIAADGQSVQLVFASQLNCPIPLPRILSVPEWIPTPPPELPSH